MPEPLRPYGRRRVEVLGTAPPDAPMPTYYARRSLKPTDWRWLIVSYLFVGGLAGAAQVIATVVDLVGGHRDRKLISAGRYLALFGSLVSPVLLVADLKTPMRWYNMLRIYRSTSPMSIGSWTLFAFGGLSSLAAVGQFLDDAFACPAGRLVARYTGVPAAAAGAVLATYTGSLLSATSTPIWAAGYRLLPPIFGLSGTATATAALSLIMVRGGAARSTRHRLQRLALLVSLAEMVLTLRLDALWKHEHLDRPLQEPPLRLPYRIGMLGLGILVPLGVHLLQAFTGRELRMASTLASLAALVGGYTQRAVIVLAGKRSAERPTDSFHFARS
ncbi:MAG: polysulfide reductase NrfD [Chloroflexi bacterium]|nr:polysulfide reductase NrfD [Chloroflexota bacterium]